VRSPTLFRTKTGKQERNFSFVERLPLSKVSQFWSVWAEIYTYTLWRIPHLFY